MMCPLRLLLVDDSLEFLQAAASFLNADPAIDVVGQFLSAEEALQALPALKPHLVLMDLAMPGLNGLEATRRIKEKPAPPRVIILTMHNNTEYTTASQAAHADGFITKSDFGTALMPLINQIFHEQLSSEVQNKNSEVPC